MWRSWRERKRKRRLSLWASRSKPYILRSKSRPIRRVHVRRIPWILTIGSFLPISLYLLACWPTSGFLKTLKRFPVSGQILDWFLNVFAKIISFSFNEILFGPSLSSFVEDNFYFVFLIRYYFDLFFLYFNWS